MAVTCRKRKRHARRFGIAGGKHLHQRGFHRIFLNGRKRSKVNRRYKLRKFTGKSLTFVAIKPRPPPVFSTDSYRLINLDLLQDPVAEITKHSILCERASYLVSCGESPVKLISEVRRMGLASVLLAQCQGCSLTFRLDTSKKVRTSTGNQRFEVNVRAVWGSMSTGGGASKLNEGMATMNAPGMTQTTYTAIEEEISKWWQTVLEEDLVAAGVEERMLAIQRGDFHQGVPAITVICDGGWSKRTHKHTYNAAGGVAVVIGACTSKLLHIGVRNKNCYICSRAESLHSDPRPHECFRNWKDSSQAMEADIIVEGFQKSETRHGVRYMRVIADGDSSVYARIQEQVPGWGRDVQKLECANHMCKCLRSSLEKLVVDKPQYKGRGKLTQHIRVRLTSAVRCAIKMRSAQSTDRQTALNNLRHDIKNSVHHIYGNHTQCSDFCRAKKESAPVDDIVRQGPSGMAEDVAEDGGTADIVPSVLGSQMSYWTEGCDDVSLKESRLSGDLITADLTADTSMLRDISMLLDRVANKADRLLGNFTSNLAECWMSIRAKFDGGKVINRCNRGSWHARCFGGALRYNLGSEWSPTAWEKVSGTAPGLHFDGLFKNRQRQTAIRRRVQSQPEFKKRLWKRKHAAATKSNTKRARLEYGPEAVEVIPDCSSDNLKVATDNFLRTQIHLEEAKLQEITDTTQDQYFEWKQERKKRLTASNFKSVVDRNPSIKVAPLVRRLLYDSFKGNAYTRHGLAEEDATLQEYVLKKAGEGCNVVVQKSGLVISRDHPFLGATPDGVVTDMSSGDVGLIEVKNVLKNKPLSIKQAAETLKALCLQLEGGTLSLKRSHAYYLQCQGQLNVMKLPWLDFIVRRTRPHEFHMERIFRDTRLWNDDMILKLTDFYQKALLPELAMPRYGKSPGIREPGNWVSLQPTDQGRL
jgi:hypothetical protein